MRIITPTANATDFESEFDFEADSTPPAGRNLRVSRPTERIETHRISFPSSATFESKN